MTGFGRNGVVVFGAIDTLCLILAKLAHGKLQMDKGLHELDLLLGDMHGAAAVSALEAEHAGLGDILASAEVTEDELEQVEGAIQVVRRLLRALTAAAAATPAKEGR